MLALHEGGLQRRVRVGLLLEQQPDDVHGVEFARGVGIRTPVPHGEPVHVDRGVQRAHPGGRVHDVRVGAGVEQQLREVVMGVDDGENERGGAVGIGEDDGSYERGFAPASPSPG